tara:strand:+ start:401 stop:1117 length:717 start_codon:yes stop_codon:yes gene_type:complete
MKKKAETRDFIHLEHPKKVDRYGYWEQIKRTVNGKPIEEVEVKLITESIIKHLELMEDDNLLDLGCGNGKLASYFFNRVNKYHGVDFSPYLLGIAKEDFFIKGKTSYQKLNLRDEATKIEELDSFNSVLCYGAFPYFGRLGGQSIIELFGSMTNISKIYLGNIPDINFVSEFYSQRDIKDYDVHDAESAIGVWWDYADIEFQFNKAGFATQKIQMPDSFYASKYRYDVFAYRQLNEVT